MKKRIAIASLVALASASCAKLLDGSTSDDVSLETAARDQDTAVPASTYRIFVTANYNGNLGGVSGADAKCNSDLNKPSGSATYKALIGATTRQPPSTDWPLKPNTTYLRSDGTTVIGTTGTDRVFTFPLTNTVQSTLKEVFTGLTPAWGVSSNTCQDWTSSVGMDSGSAGRTDQSSSGAIQTYSGESCAATTVALMCVEQ